MTIKRKDKLIDMTSSSSIVFGDKRKKPLPILGKDGKPLNKKELKKLGLE